MVVALTKITLTLTNNPNPKINPNSKNVNLTKITLTLRDPTEFHIYRALQRSGKTNNCTTRKSENDSK